jgi:hypothetical protein
MRTGNQHLMTKKSFAPSCAAFFAEAENMIDKKPVLY